MDDKSALLTQLRIDRGIEPAPSGKLRFWLIVAAACAALAAAGAWFWLRPTPVAVHVAIVRPLLRGGSDRGGSSVLDASGYVVARRQAAVASKITGKMVELNIEEGDRVKAGQVIARLDDTNIRASLNAALAQQEYAKAGLNETQVNLAN